MRVPLLIAATLMLATCGKNDQSGSNQNVDEGLTAESIVSNDVTAIDAVTGDAANMAADVDLNFGNLEAPDANLSGNEMQRAPRPRAATPRPSPSPTTNTTQDATTNIATNAD